MGVDFYTCEYCGEAFPDCGEYVHCDECWRHWCCEECAEKDGAVYKEDGDVESCKYCRCEDVDDYVLVAFMLRYFNTTREDMVKQYFNTKGNK